MALQSRPEPMNASPHHPKLKVTLRLGEPLAVAGGIVAGKMEMECKADSDKGLGIGVIMVELFAIEELTSRDHSATSTFLRSRRIFQGPGLPPSNSVHPFPQPGDPPLPPDYYGARRGTTTFLFRFELPSSSPSSINFGSGLANVRYEVRAGVSVSWKGERRLVTDRKEVDVVESFQEEFARSEPQGVIVGENGKMWVQGRIVGGVLVAGQPACVELHVKNHSSKKNSGLSITLTRELQLPDFSSTQKPPLQISDTLTSVSFRGQEYIIQSGTEGVANLVFDVPRDARGVKGGPRHGDEDDQSVTAALFEVRCIVGVKLSMGFGSKDIRLEIPISILHPAALPQIPPSVPYPLPPIQPYGATTPDIISQIPYALPISPVPPYAPHDQLFSPPPAMYMDPGQWVPTPTLSPIPVAYPPYSAGSPTYYPLHSFSPPPLLPPHTIPLRPASVEPVPSYPLHNLPSGLPASAIQQPLVPLITGNGVLPAAEREEGKGEIAARISQHLRMSSRTRSVSPQAHRYPLSTVPDPYYAPPQPSLAPIATPADTVPLPQSQPPLQMLNVPDVPTLSPEAEIVSPRPRLSPTQSYAVDPVSHVTLSKSERVHTLERMASRAIRANSDMSNSVPDINFADKDKTLPSPPVPSGKAVPAEAEPRPRVDTLFPPDNEQFGETPPTPTLAAVTSLKVPRHNRGGLSGLDALEARLLAEVGTKKVEQNNSKPDVRSVLPQPITIPRPSADVEPAVDSAISSLRLSGVESAPYRSPKIAENSPLPAERAESVHSNSHDGGRTERGRVKDRTSDGLTKRNGKQGVRKAKDHGSAERDGEIHRMRKVAQGRITDWLGQILPTAAPETDSSASPSPAPEKSTDKPEVTGDQEESRNEKIVSALEETKAEKDQQDGSAQPNPRSSGFVPIETIRLRKKQAEAAGKPDGRAEEKPFGVPRGLGVPPSRPLNFQAPYDIRSARGGRGGKVTAVAAIWANQAGAARANTKSPPPIKPPKVIKPPPKFMSPQSPSDKLMSVPAPARISTKDHAKPDHQPTSSSAARLSDRRAKMMKSTSVPAILSSSLATPMLSSTASLARPSPLSPERTKANKLLPTLSEMPDHRSGPLQKPKPTSAPKGELAFGQARLRELIKRYQGQPS